MPRQAIKQATCENCDNEESEFTVMDTDFLNDEDSTIEYDVRCSCGATGTITLDNEGVGASTGISHEDTSWNESDSDESEDSE